MKSTVSLALLLSFMTFSPGCKKEEIKGPQGDPGTPGKGGNSNISSTTVIAVTPGQWVADSSGGAWNAAITNTLLTQKVVDQGSVKVYISVKDYWAELPYFEADNLTQFGFEAGTLRLKIMGLHEELPAKPLAANYRMVIVSESE